MSLIIYIERLLLFLGVAVHNNIIENGYLAVDF